MKKLSELEKLLDDTIKTHQVGLRLSDPMLDGVEKIAELNNLTPPDAIRKMVLLYLFPILFDEYLKGKKKDFNLDVYLTLKDYATVVENLDSLVKIMAGKVEEMKLELDRLEERYQDIYREYLEGLTINEESLNVIK